MIIKEIYIENFGKLSAYRRSFSPRLNEIVEENGYGKSTMMAFMRAMLYGLDDTRSTKLDENARKRYEPWGGGAFGGYMVFEVSDKCYRVERSFGKKASDDTFALIDLDTGTHSSDFSEKLGRQIFGIDDDGFERTVFLSERNLSGKNVNPTIAAKLSDISFAEGDIGGFDNAVKLLDERRKFYQKRGGSGEIQDTVYEISATEDRLRDLRSKKASLSDYEAKAEAEEKRIADIAKEHNELTLKLADVKRGRELASNNERYLQMQLAMREDAERLAELEKFFARGVPTNEEQREANLRHTEIRTTEDEIKSLNAHTKAEGGIDAPGSFPDKGEQAKIRELCDGITALNARKIEMPPPPELSLLQLPRDGECAKIQSEYKSAKGSVPKTAFLVFAIGFAALLLGIALAIFVQPIMLTLSIIGVLLTIVGIFLTLKANKAKKAKQRVEEFIREHLGDIADGDTEAALKLIEEREAQYRDALAKYSTRSGEAAEYEARLNNLTEELFTFLQKYECDPELPPKDAAERLMQDAQRFTVLATINESNRQRADELLRKRDALVSAEREFLSRFPTESDDPISEISRKYTEYSLLSRSLFTRREGAKKFALECGIDTDTPQVSEYSKSAESDIEQRLAALSEERISAEKERVRLIGEYRLIAEDVEKTDEYEERLRELYDKRDRYNDNLAVITKTKEMLTRAKEKLTARYLERARRGLTEYMSLIGTDSSDLMLDTDFTVTKTDFGRSRITEAYSRGTRELFALGVRLSLTDALYSGADIPPLWFDDPFTMFDDKHLGEALELVKKLSRKRQVFYFTCTKGRRIQ